MRLLVVEDERKLALLLQGLLQDENHTVDLAFDGGDLVFQRRQVQSLHIGPDLPDPVGRRQPLVQRFATQFRLVPFGKPQIIGTNEEALYVIDALCHHESDLHIQEHYTDTGGSTVM